jgi:predicted metal-dependent hydrolase
MSERRNAVRLVTFAARTLRRIDGTRAAIGTDRSDMLTVTVPISTSDADIRRVIDKHYRAISQWVTRDEAVDAWQPLAKEFVAGEGFLLNGRSCRFRWGAKPGASFVRDGFGWWLEVDASLRGNNAAVRQAVIDCYAERSVGVALKSADRFAPRAGVSLPLVAKSTERDRVWVATRSGKNVLTFEAHWALAQFSLTTVDYLVARVLTDRPDVHPSLETLVPCPGLADGRAGEARRGGV